MTKQPPPIGTLTPTPPKDQATGHKMTISAWPVEREPQGVGLSVKDGWNFGIGFGVAMAIAVPLILFSFAVVIIFALVFFGGALGALL